MGKTRKDKRGYALHTGEYQRRDGEYSYSYTDPIEGRRSIYANTLAELRKKERELRREREEGDRYCDDEQMTLNQLFDAYMDQKYDLKPTTKANYLYMYDRFVRNEFGQRRICTIRHSHVKEFFYTLLNEHRMAANTLDTINNMLHPAFQMAVMDERIRSNPAEGVMMEIRRSQMWDRPQRHALTVAQQAAFTQFIEDNRAFYGWHPVIMVLLGTGMRIGECLGLRWEDLDFDNRMIHVSHSLVTYKDDDGQWGRHISTTKTRAGARTIPMIEEVYQAFLQEYEIQRFLGHASEEIDGYTNFVFLTESGSVIAPSSVNRAIREIIRQYNEKECEAARIEGRKAQELPHFSAHSLRHTFCSRLCENDMNVKVIQSVMGHSDFSTTMDIYTEISERKKRDAVAQLDGKIIVMQADLHSDNNNN